ncbi:glycosyltransferase [Patescibacteria group bacterium]|nr:glycosyltransferase [Patescibacteria group bacterium]
MKISVNCIVRNEESFLWFAVNSVADWVDEILLWDTGSTDLTPKVIEALSKKYPSKIKPKLVGVVDKKEFTKMRQEMLDESKGDWILVLDGDEVWWNDSIEKVVEKINHGNIDAIISPYTNLVGDIFHYQEESAGRYSIDGSVGNITIRAFKRNISGLHVENPYGLEGYFDETGKPIQESARVKREFVNAPYLHLTHLKRSKRDEEVMGRKRKAKFELGISFPLDFYYPEVFFKPKPNIVKSPWSVYSNKYFLRSAMEYPFRKIKRAILHV